MGWLSQTGSPGNTTILWPTRVPGRGSVTPNTDPKTLAPVTGLPKALLVTNWVDCVGGKLEFFTGATPTLLTTIYVAFPENGAGDTEPPWLPFRMEIDGDGLQMPTTWGMRLVCSLGLFEAMLIFRDLD